MGWLKYGADKGSVTLLNNSFHHGPSIYQAWSTVHVLAPYSPTYRVACQSRAHCPTD